jgi:hypothetical protein
MFDEGYSLPEQGTAEDALFQQKVKALIRTNDELRTQVQILQQRIVFLERQCSTAGQTEIAILREENEGLRSRLSAAQSAQPFAPYAPAVPSAYPLPPAGLPQALPFGSAQTPYVFQFFNR